MTPVPEGIISTSTGPVEPVIEVIEEEVISLDEEVVEQ